MRSAMGTRATSHAVTLTALSPRLGTGTAPPARVAVAGPVPPDPALCHHLRSRTPGDQDVALDFFPAGTAPPPGPAGPVVRFGPDTLDRALREVGRPWRGLAPATCLSLRDAQLGLLWRAVLAEAAAGNPGGAAQMGRLGQALAVRLATLLPVPTAPATGRMAGTVKARLLAHIEANLDGDLSLAALADVAGMSPSHLKALSRATLGEPVHRYVVRQRVARARALLEAGGLSLAQVALEAGFSHQSHMARWMRRILGTTPAALARGVTGGR